jgi:hypothetical protein
MLLVTASLTTSTIMSDLNISARLPGEDAYIATIELLCKVLDAMPADIKAGWATIIFEDYKALRGVFKRFADTGQPQQPAAK